MTSTVDDVLAAVEALPAGTVVSYSDVAQLVGTSPRRVGTIIACEGQEVDWWRVTTVRGLSLNTLWLTLVSIGTKRALAGERRCFVTMRRTQRTRHRDERTNRRSGCVHARAVTRRRRECLT